MGAGGFLRYIVISINFVVLLLVLCWIQASDALQLGSWVSLQHGTRGPDASNTKQRWNCGAITALVSISAYGQISNIKRTNCQNLNVSRLVLQLSLPNLLKPGVKSIMKMWLEQRRQAMLQLHLCA